MLKVKINNVFYTLETTGEILTADRKAINPKEWRATSIIFEEGPGKFKTMQLNEITAPLPGRVYLRSEEHGLPKLLEIQSLSLEKGK